MNDIFDTIGNAYQNRLNGNMAQIEAKIPFQSVTDELTGKMMAITIRDWTDGLLVFDGVILDVNDIRECDKYDTENIVAMVNKYWELRNLSDACAFTDDNTMILQTIIRKGHHITADLYKKQDWKEYLAQRVTSQKIAICKFITGKYDKY